MSTSVAEPPSTEPPGTDPTDGADGSPPASAFRRWAGRIGVALGISTTFLWIGAIAWGAVADPHPAGWLENRTFPKAAEPICKKALSDLDAFPPAHESKTPKDRAAVIRATTARLERMLDDLRAEVPAGRDAKWINLWIDDWGMHISDRLDFARRLETKGAKEEFFESEKAGAQISKSLDNFAEINEMPSCDTPGDV